jgi:hypothetical protein
MENKHGIAMYWSMDGKAEDRSQRSDVRYQRSDAFALCAFSYQKNGGDTVQKSLRGKARAVRRAEAYSGRTL